MKKHLAQSKKQKVVEEGGAFECRKGMEKVRIGRGSNSIMLWRDNMLKIFSFLTPHSLACCSMVCKDWYHLVKESRLWHCTYINFRKSLKTHHSDFASKLGLQVTEEPTFDWETNYVRDLHRALLCSGSVRVASWKGHSGRVNCCKMKMGTIATGSSDGTIHLWSAASLGCREKHSAPTKSPVMDLEFDESKIIGLTETELHVWSRGKGRLLRSINGHQQRAFCMCYVDPEVVIGCGDGTVRIFDIYSSRCMRIFRQHSAHVRCVAMTEGGSMLASGSADGTLKLCDTVSGQEIACILSSLPPTGIECLFLNCDSCRIFAGTTTGQIHSWDLRTYNRVWSKQISPSSIASLHQQFNDSYTMLAGGTSGILYIMDSNNGDTIAQYIKGFKLKSKVSSVSTVSRYAGVDAHDPLESIPIKHRPLILSARLGMSHAVTTHPDGTIDLWNFRLKGQLLR